MQTAAEHAEFVHEKDAGDAGDAGNTDLAVSDSGIIWSELFLQGTVTKQSLDKEQGAEVLIVRLLKSRERNQAQGIWVGHGEMSQR